MEVAFMRDSDTWQAFPIKKKLIFVTLKKTARNQTIVSEDSSFCPAWRAMAKAGAFAYPYGRTRRQPIMNATTSPLDARRHT